MPEAKTKKQIGNSDQGETWVRVGSIVIEQTMGHNMKISKVHSTDESIMIERADEEDLKEALRRFDNLRWLAGQ